MGVNVNIVSKFLLIYVFGLSKNVVEKLVNYRNDIGGFKFCEDLLKVLSFGFKIYE